MPYSDYVFPTVVALAAVRYSSAGWAPALWIWVGVHFLISSIIPFAKNILVARKSGIPLIYVFWHPHSLLWMVVCVPLRPYLKQYLPSSIWNRLAITIYGWEFQEGLKPFDQYAAPQGDRKSFYLVSCGEPEIYSWDVEVIKQVLTRPNDFQVMGLTAFFLEAFGKSVFTSNGTSWARQRKIVASVVNERISKTVFDETIKQSEGLVTEVAGAPSSLAESTWSVIDEHKPTELKETNQIFDMMKKVTMHVSSGAGMGLSVGWQEESTNTKTKPGFKMDYMSACKLVTGATFGPIILPQWILSNYPTWLPGHEFMRNLGVAMKEFPVHTNDMLQAESGRQQSKHAQHGNATRNNIMSQLLQHSKSEQNPEGLSEDEIRGNLFIFTIAGFETTANTLSFSLMMLVRYPQWQVWLQEEIDDVVSGSGTEEELDYVAIFPRCLRIQAFMLETLRLFPPLVHIVKEARGAQSVITETGKSIMIPDNCFVYLNAVALHLDPKMYRNINLKPELGEQASESDELLFRPSRWLNDVSESEDEGRLPLFQPPKGTFIPWSMGPRNCPGEKMSRVEFTGVILTLLRQHSVEAVRQENETATQMEQRIDAFVRNSFSKATLEMSGIYGIDSEDAGFRIGLRARR